MVWTALVPNALLSSLVIATLLCVIWLVAAAALTEVPLLLAGLRSVTTLTVYFRNCGLELNDELAHSFRIVAASILCVLSTFLLQA